MSAADCMVKLICFWFMWDYRHGYRRPREERLWKGCGLEVQQYERLFPGGVGALYRPTATTSALLHCRTVGFVAGEILIIIVQQLRMMTKLHTLADASSGGFKGGSPTGLWSRLRETVCLSHVGEFSFKSLTFGYDSGQKSFQLQLQGVSPMTPTRGSAHGPRWRLLPRPPL